MRIDRATWWVLVSCIGCGPQAETEPDGGSTTMEASDSSTGDGSAEGPSTSGATTTGLDSGSEGPDTEDSGSEPPPFLGTWSCMGYEDPLWVSIEAYDPPNIEGLGCGVDLQKGPSPFENDNCDALDHNPGIGALQFQFELPYEDFPGFGPIGVEFVGGYDPQSDTMVGTLWVSDVAMTRDGVCERIEL